MQTRILGLLTVVAVLSGCQAQNHDPDPSAHEAAPDVLSVVETESPPNNVRKTSGFPHDTKGLDITRVRFEERVTHVNVTVYTTGLIDKRADYRVAMWPPGTKDFALAEVNAGAPAPGGVTYRVWGNQISIQAPYHILATVTNVKEFVFRVRTDFATANQQAVDETPEIRMKWSMLRPIPFGAGPFEQRTQAFEDACCDPSYLSPRGDPNGSKKNQAGDLRFGWIWQDTKGLWIEANATAEPVRDEELNIRYPGKDTSRMMEIFYTYRTGKITKNDEEINATAQRTTTHGVRLHVPWEHLQDRAHSDRVLLTFTIWSQNRLYADAAEVTYWIENPPSKST